ncbi:mucin-22-like [Xyrauchen texanus]|uniref:mucin-22-like n=1 Tax=Xyrauchen texanus TaxID=154827 RepID=UPI0022423BD3|nr:mucin-22-like [Xyrauchen texanus]
MVILRFRSGSIVTDSVLEFDNNGTRPNVSEVTNTFVQAATNGNFNFTVDTNSINITELAASPNNTNITSASPNNINITTASPNRTNITTASPNNTNITTASPNNINIKTASPNNTNITTASPNRINITTASPNRTNITTASTISTTTSTASTISTTTSTPPVTKFNVIFSISETFNAVYSNLNDPETIKLKDRITTEVFKVYKIRFPNFVRMVILQFRSGSIVTDSVLEFDNNGTRPNVSEVTNTFVQAATNGNFNFTVDTNSINITELAGQYVVADLQSGSIVTDSVLEFNNNGTIPNVSEVTKTFVQAATNGNFNFTVDTNSINITELAVTQNETSNTTFTSSITTASPNNNSITTLSPINTDITAASPNNTNITTASPNNSNITTASPNNTNITTASPNNTNITTASPNNTITTASPINTNITTVSPNNSNITTASPNNSNITTASPINSNITTASLNRTNITTASPNNTNITTASPNNSNITTASPNNNNITTASPNNSNITTASPYNNNITTASPNNTNITTASPNRTNITTALPNRINITTTSLNRTNITTASLNNSNITTSSPNRTNITTASLNRTNITTASLNNSNITTSSPHRTNITSASPHRTNITTASPNRTNITTASPNRTNITTTSAISTTTSTASTISTTTAPVTIFNIIFSISETFNAVYSNLNDPETIKLKDRITTGVFKVYKIRFPNFVRMVILQFRSGSIVTDGVLEFDNNVTRPNVSEVKGTFVQAATNGNFNFTVDTNSVNVSELAGQYVLADLHSITTASTISTTTSTAPVTKFNVIFSISETFNAVYSNLNDPETIKLKDRITTEVFKVYKIRFPNFIRMVILRFRSGSIVTDSVLEFDNNGTRPNVSEVKDTFVQGATNGNFSFTVDLKSVNVSELAVSSNTTTASPSSTNTTTASPSSTSITTAPVKQFGVTFKIMKTFLNVYSDMSAIETIQLANTITSQIMQVYRVRFVNFLRMFILQFRSGSIVTDGVFEFHSSGTIPNVTEVARTLVQAVKDGNFTFTIDVNSINVTDSSGNTSSRSPVLASMLTALWMTLTSLLLSAVMHL